MLTRDEIQEIGEEVADMMAARVAMRVDDEVTDRVAFLEKDVWSAQELCHFLCIKRAYLYKLTMEGRIPHYKPGGKVLLFDRKEIMDWIHSAPGYCQETIQRKLDEYLRKNPCPVGAARSRTGY